MVISFIYLFLPEFSKQGGTSISVFAIIISAILFGLIVGGIVYRFRWASKNPERANRLYEINMNRIYGYSPYYNNNDIGYNMVNMIRYN